MPCHPGGCAKQAAFTGRSAGPVRPSTTTSSAIGPRNPDLLRPWSQPKLTMPPRHGWLRRTANRLRRALSADAQVIVRGLVQGPPVDAPVEITIKGQDIAVLRAAWGRSARDHGGSRSGQAGARPGSAEARRRCGSRIDEVKARLLGLDIGDVAFQLNTALSWVSPAGPWSKAPSSLPVRVRMGDGLRGDLQADCRHADPAARMRTPAFRPPVSFRQYRSPNWRPMVVEPSESVITRTDGIRENTVQAFHCTRMFCPKRPCSRCFRRWTARGFANCPLAMTLALGGDSDARSNTVGNLMASVGLIVTLTIATIALTFNSFRLTAVALVSLRSVCGPVHAVARRDAVSFRDPGDHRGDRFDRRVDQCGHHHPDRTATGCGCQRREIPMRWRGW